MKTKTLTGAAAVAVAWVLAVGPLTARAAPQAPPDSICAVLDGAARYLNTTVTVRGIASSEGTMTTLSDAQCKGAVALAMDEKAMSKRDVSSFRRTVNAKGTRADATVFGRFKATGDTRQPYAIDVYSVRDVNELRVAEGG
jgi:cation transport regulator ChaC